MAKYALMMDGIEPAFIDHTVVWFLTWCHSEDTKIIEVLENDSKVNSRHCFLLKV